MPDITLLPALAAELGVTSDVLLHGEKAVTALPLPATSGEDLCREGFFCL